MVRSNDLLETQLLALPLPDRARLAEVLLASLESATGSLAETEAAWRAESGLRRRWSARYSHPRVQRW